MFMFDQVCVYTPIIFVVISVCPFVFGISIGGQFTKEDSTPPNLIGFHANDGINGDID